MYSTNRLEWHPGDERQKRNRTPQGTVWSCRVVSDWDFSLLTNRLAAAHAKSQDHRASCGVLLLDDLMRYVDGQIWDTPLHEQAKAGAVGEVLEPGG